ncbi:MAG: hypothetical protein KatS3mg015_3124 [Fimbriimonadales bacterium]|nr:MAG: hypothetical protein KatS3mg015_3124 [Fimbriimonadales bacterium]
MNDLDSIRKAIAYVDSPDAAGEVFKDLGYPVIPPLPEDLSHLPQGARAPVASVDRLVHLGDGSPLRIYQVQLKHATIRRTDVRRFLEAFYRHYPQGENLFLFAPPSYDQMAFVSPRRLSDPRDPGKVRLWLRILPVHRERPYRTDLEALSRIRTDGILDPEELWRRHDQAFSVQRVSEQFFRDYAEIFDDIRSCLTRTHRSNGPEWARDYAHQLLNRIMFLYFIARKGWLLGPDGGSDREFMRHFWDAYRNARSRDRFHQEWLNVLFFEAFNNKWQNRREYSKRFPRWLVQALALAPFLNGGLYAERRDLDDRLQRPLPDEIFALLFETWTDGTFPGLFERYNFTVVESGRFDEEVAVDPEMLGMVYERLVNITFEAGDEDLRSTAGIFYTPRTEIDLMCRLALVDWLANHLGTERKTLLYHWVFAFGEEEKHDADAEMTKAGVLKQLSDLVRRVRVCDPACGSGSFLVGMMLVLDDLQARCSAALGEKESPYERRKRILQDQLYGVDVMEWAVRVAELRLWLQLLVETDIPKDRRKFSPLLPNLDLKLRPGDSLLQTLGDLDLSPFRRSELSLSRSLKSRIAQLRRKKQQFFRGENGGMDEASLKKEEYRLFRDILATKAHELEEQIKKARSRLAGVSSQPSLAGLGVSDSDPAGRARERIQAEIEQLTKERDRYQRAVEALRPDQPPPFVWDLAFVEVFEDDNPGFDIIIGNPPYVRQERIRDYLERFERGEYLDRINEGLRAIYPAFMRGGRSIGRRADYYVYFYLHALSLVASSGTFCFITSNSWLDVDFGKDLQEFFLRHGHLKVVIDNRAKRSFAQADINTVIVVAAQPQARGALTEAEMKQRLVRFVAFRAPFEEAISPVVFCEIEDERLYESLAGFRVLRRPEFRAIVHDQLALYQEGLAEPEEGENEEAPRRKTRRRRRGAPALAGLDFRPYAGNKWGGKYLRAPDIFFTILEKGKGKLVRLGDIAEVRRGFTTGANEFFYLEPVGRTVKHVAELGTRDPRAPVRVKNGAGWEGEIEAAWLRPVIKSPREIRTVRVRLEDLRYLVFMPPEDARTAMKVANGQPWRAYPCAVTYIRWGETRGYQKRPTCRSRHPWWDLGIRNLPKVAWVKSVNDNHRQALVPFEALVDQRFYEVCCDNPQVTAGLINSTSFLLAKEVTSRVNLGEGVLDTAVYEANATLTAHPGSLAGSRRMELLTAFERLACRPIRSIFEEVGFAVCRKPSCDSPEHPYEDVKPQTLTLSQVRRASPDRYDLDAVIFDVLDLTEDERLEVYRAVTNLVKDRLVKARSV